MFDADRKRLQMYLPQLRSCAGLSAEALAKKIGLTKQAISFIEKHPEKQISKMQYICIRAALEEEYHEHPDNINLRDCYDLVFSDVDFYKKNKDRIEYALYQMVEDTKVYKRKKRADIKKALQTGGMVEGFIAGGAVTGSAAALAGATATTAAIGGIAAATFPVMFAVGAVIGGKALATKEKKKNLGSKDNNRASARIEHSSWMREAFEAMA